MNLAILIMRVILAVPGLVKLIGSILELIKGIPESAQRDAAGAQFKQILKRSPDQLASLHSLLGDLKVNNKD